MAYRTVIELDSKNARAWNTLGDLHYTNGATEEALQAYQKAADSGRDCLLSYGNLASIYVQKGRLAEAIPMLQKGIELSNDAADTIRLWNRLGDAYRRLDDYEHAMDAYRNADALDPQKASVQSETYSAEPDLQFSPSENLFVQPGSNFKLRSMQEQAFHPGAVEPVPTCPSGHSSTLDVKDAIPTGPETVYINWLDGLASAMSEFHNHANNAAAGPDPDEAANPEDIEAMVLQFVQPDADYPVFTKDEPIQPVTEESASWYEPLPEFTENQSVTDADRPALDETDDSPQVEAVSPTGAAIEEENAHLWNELGTIYLNTGAFDEAINAFQRAIELDRSYGWSYHNLAALYSRQGRYKDAIPLYQKGLKYLGETKDKALLWNRLGDAYRRLDEHDRASSAYRKAMELDPDNVSLLTRARFSLLGNCRA